MTISGEVSCQVIEIDRSVLAIVMLGHPTVTSGFKLAEYFQVTIDPNMASPNGEYIRFGMYEGDEIVGWQRTEALTICEILGDSSAKRVTDVGYSNTNSKVSMRAIQ